MKALSLLQPWASLLVAGRKQWETRSWKPSDAMRHILSEQGFLIHASAKFDSQNKRLLTYPPFMKYYRNPDDLPIGMIIGMARLGRVISTFDWKQEFIKLEGENEEFEFGNYGPNRWAWEILNPVIFENPIPCKGALSLWEYQGEFPRIDKPDNF